MFFINDLPRFVLLSTGLGGGKGRGKVRKSLPSSYQRENQAIKCKATQNST